MFPDLPTPTDAEMLIIRREQERRLYALVDAAGLKGGLPEAIRRFTIDTIPIDALLPSSVPEKWFGTFDVAAKDEEVRAYYEHYFQQPKSRGMLDAASYATTQMMMDFTAEQLRLREKLHGPTPLAANLPTGGIGATILSSPASDRSIMFYPSGLFDYLGDIAKVVSFFFKELTIMRVSQDRILQQCLHPSDNLLLCGGMLTHAVSAMAIYDHPIQASRIQVGREQRLLAMHLINYTQMFVFVHEIAHQELGHLKQGHSTSEQFMADEYAADRFAMEAVCEITQATIGSWAIGFWACQLALLSFELLDVALKILDARQNNAPWISENYPSPESRRRLLYNRAREIAEADSLQAADAGITLTCHALNLHQNNVELDLINMRFNLGLKPAPIWRSYLVQHYGLKSQEAR